MDRKIHLVIPMSGQGVRYKNAGYKDPKPLIPISGIPMIKRVLSQFPETWPAHFILAENHKKTKLPGLLKKLRPHATFDYVAPHAKGPSYAMQKMTGRIPKQDSVLVSYCDYGMVWDPIQFERFVQSSACDACVVSYRGFHAHYLSSVNYAFSRMEGGRVREIREKENFTPNRENEFASCGAYYFKSADLLKKSIDYQMKKNLHFGGEFYTSLTTEALLRMRPHSYVTVFEIAGFFQWGTPHDLECFEYWEKTYSHVVKLAKRGHVQQVLMPMAGRGSRLENIFSRPKPLVSFRGKALFEKALDSLPQAETVVLVALEKLRDQLDRQTAKSNCKIAYLRDTPDGQALSTQAGLAHLDPEKEVLVTACDHAIVLGDEWERFHSKPDCDAAILTVRGFPGVSRKPAAYAYVQNAAKSGRYPLVNAVSVKTPLSSKPTQDSLLVGTFWFKKAKILNEGIEELVRQNKRVNGELYLDSIFMCLKEKGYRVRNLPLKGYINWGDPDSLAEAGYWEEQFGGERLRIRGRFEGVDTE